ncbi:MAG: PQQ-binding-like beta-propeller repeat protein [Spirochaetaceae bacterium]|nr:PQQ-binding-like beta-propeller repeat protein [Spirochaetaceae bacterium]
MKKSVLKIFACTAILSILLLTILSCSKSQTAAVQTKPKEDVSSLKVSEVIKSVEDLTSVSIPDNDEGIIIFISGDVSIREDGKWYEAVIGDIIKGSNNLVKVGSDSYCEIQFTNRAVIKIQENSEIDLAVINTRTGEANVNLDMKIGTVLCKVQKLTSEESFRVKTQTAVCGVRGTEFIVLAENGRDTRLSVKEGAVTVLPRSVDVDNLRSRVAGKGNAVELIDKIERQAPVVKANQEIVIDDKVVANTKKVANNVEVAVTAIEKEKSATVSQASINQLNAAISEQQKVVNTSVGQPKALSEESAKNLAQIDQMQMLDLNVDLQGNMPKIYKISVESLTEGAAIELNGKFAGFNSYAGCYVEDSKVSFNISRDGYIPYTFEFSVTNATSKAYKIELVPDPNAKPVPVERTKEISVKTLPANADIVIDNKTVGKGSYTNSFDMGANIVFTAQTAGYTSKTVNVKIDANTPSVIEILLDKIPDPEKTIIFTAVPNDSQIYINNRAVGKGKHTETIKQGTKVTVSASRNGYATKTATIDVRENTPESFSLTLDKKPIDIVLSPFSNKIINKVTYSNGRIFAADSSGAIYSSTLEGKSEWKKTTANSPNGNSYLVTAGNTVIFTGTKEMLVMDTATGNINNLVALDTNSTHMFGRRVVPYNNNFIYPRNNSLLISSLMKGAKEEIVNLPVETGMTPAIWKNTIVIADIEGNVRMINPTSKTIDASIKTSAVQPIALNIAISGDAGYFADRNGTVVAIDFINKKVLWESKINDSKPNVFTDLVYDNGNLFAYTGSKIFSFNMQTGKEAFAPTESTCAPALIDGKLYYGNIGGSLIEAEVATGKTLRTIRVNDGTITTVPTLAEGKIVVGTSTGKIVVLNPAGF